MDKKGVFGEGLGEWVERYFDEGWGVSYGNGDGVVDMGEEEMGVGDEEVSGEVGEDVE